MGAGAAVATLPAAAAAASTAAAGGAAAATTAGGVAAPAAAGVAREVVLGMASASEGLVGRAVHLLAPPAACCDSRHVDDTAAALQLYA